MKMTLLWGCWMSGGMLLGQAVDMRTLLEQSLDQPAQISLQNVKLIDLFAELEKKTGVEVRMAPEVMKLLPHGPDTLFTQAEFTDIPLRIGLDELFGSLGMTLKIRRDHVEVVPKPALTRIGCRADWSELETLSYLTQVHPGLNAQEREGLRERIQFRVPSPDAWSTLTRAMEQAGAGSGDEVLDIACAALQWSWYPEDRTIVILPIEAQIGRQLKQTVRLRMTRKPLVDVLSEISRQCGVPITLDPAALATLPNDVRNRFTLEAEGYAADEALNAVASSANLGYVIAPEGVVFYNPLQTPAARAPSSDPPLGVIPVKLDSGQEVYLILRESDLPPEAIEKLMQLKAKAIQAILQETAAP